jgi:hypothetical protein
MAIDSLLKGVFYGSDIWYPIAARDETAWIEGE